MGRTRQSTAAARAWAALLLCCASRLYLGLAASLAVIAAVPAAAGWHPTVVMSGSMTPRIHPGDVMVTMPLAADRVRVGQVALVHDPARPGALLGHRVAGFAADGSLITRGDANGHDDSTPVPPGGVVGIGRLLVPHVGSPVRWLDEQAWLPLTGWLAATGAALALAGLRLPRRRRARDDGGSTPSTGPDDPGPAGPFGPGLSGAGPFGAPAGLEGAPVAATLAASPVRAGVLRGLVPRRRTAAAGVAVAAVVLAGLAGLPGSQAAWSATTGNPADSWATQPNGTGPTSSFPYYAAFASGQSTDWTTYGGTWAVSASAETYSTTGTGEMKSVTGNGWWTDYTLQSDVRVSGGGGDAGVLVRASNVTTGVDAENGYYVGVDVPNGRLAIGREDYGYTALASSPVSLALNTWYHLVVQVVGCSVTATVQPAGSTTLTTATASDCAFPRGQVGLRAINVPGAWRNVTVTPGGRAGGAPYQAPFASGTATGFTTYGGTWSADAASGSYSDSGAGNGDKAVAPNPASSDSTVSADVRLSQTTGGDAGVIVRVSSPAVGADSFTGYYVGVDRAGVVKIGRMMNNYRELARATVPGGITTGVWYHLTMQVVGCTVTASAQPVTSFSPTVVTATEPSSTCVTGPGSMGVRQYGVSESVRYMSQLPR